MRIVCALAMVRAGALRAARGHAAEGESARRGMFGSASELLQRQEARAASPGDTD